MKAAGGMSIFQMMISSLLVAITASSVVPRDDEFVLDNFGNPLIANFPYVIHSENLDMSILNQEISSFGSTVINPLSCPQRVLLSSISFTPSTPVIFELSSDMVRVSTELNIRFHGRSHCGESGYWRVEDSSSPIKEVVLTGSKSSKDSTFTIKKTDNPYLYRLAFGSADKPIYIGLDDASFGYGIQRLILSKNSGFDVYFVPKF